MKTLNYTVDSARNMSNDLNIYFKCTAAKTESVRKFIRSIRFWILLPFLPVIVMLFAVGCTMAPKYTRPDAPIPNHYPQQNHNEHSDVVANPAPPAWKAFFKDEIMREVIELALVNNRDLRISMLNIERIRAQYRIQRADLLPTVNAASSATIQSLPADVSSTGERGRSRQYSASLGFSAFELDLFGRIRSLSEQALQTYYSAEEEAKSARISLVAETAAMYLQLVADRENYDLAMSTMLSWEKKYDLIKYKYEAGVASDLDLSQARSFLDESRVNLAGIAIQVGQDENALALLIGCPIPETLPKIRRLADVVPLKDIPEGLPSTLLERRPDIRAAEHLLKGANANIGAARANFFPSISLTGNLGKLSMNYRTLFNASQDSWLFMPQITVPIFDVGRNMALLDMSKTDRKIAVAQYEKTIQNAFKEVADTLVTREFIGERMAAQESLVESTLQSHLHASSRYDAGVSDYLNVLDAKRSLYAAQIGLIGALLSRESNALMLYKTLGGGWE